MKVKLTFNKQVFLTSAWNGSLEIHQINDDKKRVDTIPDLREYIADDYDIETFTGFIDAKDPYTNGHSKRVADYTRMIAEKMGYEGEELDSVYYIALLHDCGKIGVPDNILRKPGRLTDEEFEVIKSHTDAFDAMNSNRVYRNKLTKEDIVNEIEKNKGKQFDPKIADTFLRLIRDKSIDFDLS